MTIPIIGQPAPDFTLPNQDGTLVSLHDFQGKWLVLYCYPKDDTPGCTIEAIDFTNHLTELQKAGAVVIGMSPDSPKSHCQFQEKHTLTVPLLSDESKKTLEAYGVWGKKRFMGREYLGVFRTTFLINPQGKISWVWKEVKVEGHVKEVLQKVQELQRSKAVSTDYPLGYFEAILQLRDVTPEIISFVEERLTKKNVFVGKIVSQANGMDYYLGTHQSAKQLGKLLQQHFGGELLMSVKLHTFERTKSKRVYRLTVLFRGLPVRKGDTVIYKGERYLIKGVAKNIQAIHQTNKKKIQIPLSEGKRLRKAED